MDWALVFWECSEIVAYCVPDGCRKAWLVSCFVVGRGRGRLVSAMWQWNVKPSPNTCGREGMNAFFLVISARWYLLSDTYRWESFPFIERTRWNSTVHTWKHMFVLTKFTMMKLLIFFLWVASWVFQKSRDFQVLPKSALVLVFVQHCRWVNLEFIKQIASYVPNQISSDLGVVYCEGDPFSYFLALYLLCSLCTSSLSIYARIACFRVRIMIQCWCRIKSIVDNRLWRHTRLLCEHPLLTYVSFF